MLCAGIEFDLVHFQHFAPAHGDSAAITQPSVWRLPRCGSALERIDRGRALTPLAHRSVVNSGEGLLQTNCVLTNVLHYLAGVSYMDHLSKD